MAREGVLVIGSLNYDMFLKVKQAPKIGETYPADGMNVAAGGKGANQAVQCAKLGLDTRMAGAVGTDPMGDFLLNSLTENGVNAASVRRVQGSSGIGVVHCFEDGSVFATIVRGANFEVSRADVDAAADLMDKAAYVVLQLEIPIEVVEYAIEQANLHGAKVLLNAAPAAAIGEQALHGCETIMANEVEASFYTHRTIVAVEDAMEAIVPFAKHYGANVVFTLGEKGSVASDGETAVHVPARKVQAVETTGAGDSFVGGYVKAMQQGMSLEEAVRFATRCSAITVSNVGAQSSMPTLAQVEASIQAERG